VRQHRLKKGFNPAIEQTNPFAFERATANRFCSAEARDALDLTLEILKHG